MDLVHINKNCDKYQIQFVKVGKSWKDDRNFNYLEFDTFDKARFELKSLLELLKEHGTYFIKAGHNWSKCFNNCFINIKTMHYIRLERRMLCGYRYRIQFIRDTGDEILQCYFNYKGPFDTFAEAHNELNELLEYLNNEYNITMKVEIEK